MHLSFEAVAEPRPGPRWQALFRRYWPAYRAWLIHRDRPGRPTPGQSRAALQRYMPELLATYDRLLELADGDPLAARLLSCYRPPAYLISCSQAALDTPTGPLLVRNYDLDPSLNEGLILHSRWSGRRVMGTSEFLWGLADGLNDAGLAVSLAFGGRRAVGDGFGIPLIVRYLLEVCDDLHEAVAALHAVPSHMAYNLTLLDRRGRSATVEVGPNRPLRVRQPALATNHQGTVEWAEHGRFTATVKRAECLRRHLADPATDPDALVDAFLGPPLYNTDYGNGFGTLYTAVYRPTGGSAGWHWPGAVWRQTLDDFREGARQVHYSAAGARVADPGIHADPVCHGATTTADLDPALAAVRAGLAAGGCRLAPALQAWFAEAGRGGRIPWERLGSAIASQYRGR